MTRRAAPQARIPFQPTQTCGGKRRYTNARLAEHIKEEQELLHPGLQLRVYKCNVPGCGGWHLTREEITKEA